MFQKTNYINQSDVALNYIKLHAIENVKVTEMNLVIEKNDRISVITIPKNAEMLIKILNNVKERQEQMN